MKSPQSRVALALCLVALAATGHAHVLAAAAATNNDNETYKLPDGFLLGAGTSAYQLEGAWDADGKGENVFDHYYHSRNKSASQTGDVAADFYNRYEGDIDIAKSLGFNVFRLSFSWARIFPNGRKDNVNQKGVEHYHKVLDYLIKNKIEPMVTIFHFDYPQTLEAEFGGWLGDKMPDVFAEYADFVFNEYGSKVKYWLTINEATMYCNLAGRMIPPRTIKTDAQNNLCIHHLILGHAKAHKIYSDKYRSKFNGYVGFGAGPYFSRPKTDSEADKLQAKKQNLGSGGIGLGLDPLVFGDYNEIAKASADRPTFTDEEKALIKGRVDFAGVNVYTGQEADATNPNGGGGPPSPPSGGGGGGGGGGGPGGDDDDDDDVMPGPPPGQGGGGAHGDTSTDSAWVLRDMPKWVNERYSRLPVFITENGLATGTAIDDWEQRAVYASAFIRELIAGVNQDKNNVIGYTMWGLLDDFEFPSYDMGWGIVHVDYQGGTLERTVKKSGDFFKELAKTRVVPLVEAKSKSSAGSLQASLLLALTALVAGMRFH